MDDKIQLRRIEPLPSIVPRYPDWEVTVEHFGIVRRTLMTEEEYFAWHSQHFKAT